MQAREPFLYFFLRRPFDAAYAGAALNPLDVYTREIFNSMRAAIIGACIGLG